MTENELGKYKRQSVVFLQHKQIDEAPPDKWRQANKADAEYRLMDLSERLLQLAKVHSLQLEANADTEVALFRIVGEKRATDEILYLTEQLKEQARQDVDAFFNNTDKQRNLAIIAEIMSRIR